MCGKFDIHFKQLFTSCLYLVSLRLANDADAGYNTFKDIARTSTHTVLATFGLEHRPREVYPVRTQLLICDHPERMTNQPTCLNREQCRSCLDRFVKNVVEEVLRVRVPTPCMC